MSSSTSSASSGTSEAAFESSCSAVEGDELAVPGRTSPSSRRPVPSTPPPAQQQAGRTRPSNGSGHHAGYRRGVHAAVGDVESSSAGPSASGSFVHKVTMEELLSPSFNGIVAANPDTATIVTPKELSPSAPASAPPVPAASPVTTPAEQVKKKRKGRAFSVLFQRFSAAKTGFIRRNRRDSQTTPSKDTAESSPALSATTAPSESSPALRASPEPSSANSSAANTPPLTTGTSPGVGNGADVAPFALKDTPGAPLAETLLKPSTTRLRTLPPKDPKEEAKHLKMRKQMEKQYLKKMKKEEKAERESSKRQARREALMQKNTRTWMDNVLPNWDKHYDSKLLRNLIRQGVPTHLRGAVWPLCIGNSLGLTHELYRIYSDRADRVAERVKLQRELREREKERIRKNAEQSTSSTGDADGDDDDDDEYEEVLEERERANTLERTELETLDMIALDIPRTFPDLQFYQQPGPQQDLLRCVLHAFVCYRPDIG